MDSQPKRYSLPDGKEYTPSSIVSYDFKSFCDNDEQNLISIDTNFNQSIVKIGLVKVWYTYRYKLKYLILTDT